METQFRNMFLRDSLLQAAVLRLQALRAERQEHIKKQTNTSRFAKGHEKVYTYSEHSEHVLYGCEPLQGNKAATKHLQAAVSG